MKNILLILLFFPLGLWAQIADVPSSVNFQVQSSKSTDQGIERVAQGTGGFLFTFTGPEVVTDREIRRIEDILKTFSSWNVDTLKSFQIYIHPDRFDIAFMPQTYIVKGKDLASYFPAGLFFTWKNNLEYNFRIRLQGLLIKIAGVYTTKVDFEERLLSAVDNPVFFLQKNDPEYLFKKVAELQNLTEELVSRVKIIDNQYQAAKDALIDGEKNLKNALIDIQKNTKDLDLARKAFMAYVNRDFFGGVHPIKPVDLEKVINLRGSKAQWDEKEFLVEYRKAGGNLNDYEVGLILAVFFGIQ